MYGILGWKIEAVRDSVVASRNDFRLNSKRGVLSDELT